VLCKVKTKVGTITVNKAVIGRIISEALAQFKGRVWVSNRKGKIIGYRQRFVAFNATDYIDINIGEKGLDIRIYIVVRFGTSIGMTTEQLIHDIKYDIERLTEIEVNSIAIIITGLISKQMTRRNIEIKG
jgi:uncharacterized alkaline shock family protein YloU